MLVRLWCCARLIPQCEFTIQWILGDITVTTAAPVSVVNSGGHAIWLPDNSEPFASSAIGGFVGGVKTDWVFVGAKDRGVKLVQPGEGLVYQICMSEAYTDFEVMIEVQDWRGRSKTIEDRVYVLKASEAGVSTAPYDLLDEIDGSDILFSWKCV